MQPQISIDKTWTLFLDRDGVINTELPGDYVKTVDELEIMPGVPEAMARLSKIFGHIFIVTNQRGVGRGIMTEEELSTVHNHLQKLIIDAGGRIDKIYYCTDIDNDSINRKPNPGMGLQAKKDFPSINLHKSYMVGNHLSDMQFGRNIGAKTVYIASTHPEVDPNHTLIDIYCKDLPEFATLIGA
jgi:histidinol-phosphate phosphatase family protein